MNIQAVERLLFHPTKRAKNEAPAGAVNIDIPLADGVILGARLFSHAPSSPTLIFFHGNTECVPEHDEIGPCYVAEGLNFLVIDYRGFGWSGDEPRLATLLPDAGAAFLYVKNWLAEHGYTGPLAVMGRSLGSACAIEVAARYGDDIRALVIESGFARALPVAQALGLEQEDLTDAEDPFANTAKIGGIGKPTLILHGSCDQLIGLWQAELLHERSAAKNKELQVVPGAGHNTVIEKGGRHYFTAIGNFVGKAAGTAPDWRARRRALRAGQAPQNGESQS